MVRNLRRRMVRSVQGFCRCVSQQSCRCIGLQQFRRCVSQQKVVVMSLVRHGIASFPRRFLSVAALVALIAAMGATWQVTTADAKPAAQTAPAQRNPPAASAERDSDDDERPASRSRKELTGKLNLNTASEEQLQLLPTVGPAKAERIVAWRKKNGGFKRPADLRKVKGFGYKTLKRLEPFLDVSGDTTLAEK
jgi:competence ComEA-like helix-hairpin-helix protein